MNIRDCWVQRFGVGLSRLTQELPLLDVLFTAWWVSEQIGEQNAGVSDHGYRPWCGVFDGSDVGGTEEPGSMNLDSDRKPEHPEESHVTCVYDEWRDDGWMGFRRGVCGWVWVCVEERAQDGTVWREVLWALWGWDAVTGVVMMIDFKTNDPQSEMNNGNRMVGCHRCHRELMVSLWWLWFVLFKGVFLAHLVLFRGSPYRPGENHYCHATDGVGDKILYSNTSPYINIILYINPYIIIRGVNFIKFMLRLCLFWSFNLNISLWQQSNISHLL